jgi:hypothetical protein
VAIFTVTNKAPAKSLTKVCPRLRCLKGLDFVGSTTENWFRKHRAERTHAGWLWDEAHWAAHVKGDHGPVAYRNLIIDPLPKKKALKRVDGLRQSLNFNEHITTLMTNMFPNLAARCSAAPQFGTALPWPPVFSLCSRLLATGVSRSGRDWSIGKMADPEAFTSQNRFCGVQVSLHGRQQHESARLKCRKYRKPRRYGLEVASLAIGELTTSLIRATRRP